MSHLQSVSTYGPEIAIRGSLVNRGSVKVQWHALVINPSDLDFTAGGKCNGDSRPQLSVVSIVPAIFWSIVRFLHGIARQVLNSKYPDTFRYIAPVTLVK